jgi:hypothetical protein
LNFLGSNISASLSLDDKNAILQAVKLIKEKLPFLINLNQEDRQKLRKMGDIRTSYVQDVYQVATANPSSIPSGFSLEEYGKDVELKKAIAEIQTVLSPVCEGLNDTEMALGAELMKQSDECYGYLKVVAKKSSNQNLNDTVKKIADHMKQGPRKAKGGVPPTAK